MHLPCLLLASIEIRERQASSLPSYSFGFHPTMDTLEFV